MTDPRQHPLFEMIVAENMNLLTKVFEAQGIPLPATLRADAEEIAVSDLAHIEAAFERARQQTELQDNGSSNAER
ncbi:hypothetical protein EVC12_106 [Rhizobium phage RHph_I42]|nr:hypothetical protein EVC12_106 [Rhizobium phage RHph_I42]